MCRGELALRVLEREPPGTIEELMLGSDVGPEKRLTRCDGRFALVAPTHRRSRYQRATVVLALPQKRCVDLKRRREKRVGRPFVDASRDLPEFCGIDVVSNIVCKPAAWIHHNSEMQIPKDSGRAGNTWERNRERLAQELAVITGTNGIDAGRRHKARYAAQQGLHFMETRFTFPCGEIGNLSIGKFLRECGGVQKDGYQHSFFEPGGGFPAYPLALLGDFRPQQNHGTRARELGIKFGLPQLTRFDAAIPPDGPTVRFKKRHDWAGPRAIDVSVAKKNIRQKGRVPELSAKKRERLWNNRRGCGVIKRMTRDLRFALRMILSHPWFSAAVLATLALGIGLNTMVFTIIDVALFKPVPLPGGARLVVIGNQNVSQGNRRVGVSYPDFREYRAAASLEGLEAGTQDQAILSEQGNPPQAYRMERVSPGMFDMLHMPPILGHGFAANDGKAGAAPVVLIGYGVWKERYGSSPQVLGRAVRVNGKPATIIGVMPEGFKFPNNENLWMPLAPTPELETRSNRPLELFAILKPGVGIKQATAEIDGIARRLAAQHPETNKAVGAVVQTFHQRYNGGPIRMVFLLMQAAVGCVLLIACANVANMMLSRALSRQREISIRAAMGASRWQVIRQLLIESVLLSVLGGMLGLGLAAAGVHWFDLATQDVGRPYWVEFKMDYTVFGYFAGLCILSALLFGVVPALRSSRVDVSNALKEGSRSVGTQRGGKLAGALVVFQFALTLVLLMGAGTFVRGFLENESLNRWLPANRLLLAMVRLPKAHYADAESHVRFFRELLPQVSAIPSVTNVALVSNPPGMGAEERHIEIEHSSLADATHGPMATILVGSPGYFNAIDLPILRGRNFDENDGAPGRRSAIVTKEFAERFWPHQVAAGKRFRIYRDDKPGDWLSVVGISGDIAQYTNGVPPGPLLFLPYRQEGYDSMFLMVRSSGNPEALTSAVRAAVQKLDQDLPLFETRTLAVATERNLWYLRLFSKLFTTFALMALVMAAVGIYAVIAQATSQRTQEIGVRMALGATSRNILGLVLSRGMWQLMGGLAFGLAAAIPAARVMGKLPLRVSASDPVAFAVISLLLVAIGLFACWIPARRAAALNPINAIRYE